MKCAFELLARRPEQEAHLLTTLVNKLGDPARKIASKTGYLMLSLLAEHPAMTMVIVREVEKFVFRPAFGDRARYYAIIFLNQIILSHKGEGPAVRFFVFFLSRHGCVECVTKLSLYGGVRVECVMGCLSMSILYLKKGWEALPFIYVCMNRNLCFPLPKIPNY